MGRILDQFGRPVLMPRRPETREVAAVTISDRWSGYPSAGLTPSRLNLILRAADGGSLREQAELFEEMEEKDAHLAAVLQTRKLAVLSLDWLITPASEDKGDEAVAEFCREQLAAMNFREGLLHLLDAIGKGYAALEMHWQTQGRRWGVERLTAIHAKNISFVNSLAPLIVTEKNPGGEEPPPFKVLYHRHTARSGHDTRNGVLRVCAWMYLFKNYALKDWAIFNEVYGMPLRLGKYEPSATPEDRAALRSAISSLGTDAAGIISKNTEIEFIEASSRLSGMTNPYQVMAEFCNREISKAVLGQTLTTDTTGGTGTYAAGRVHDEVRRDLVEADAVALAATIREQLLRPLVAFNFGWDRPVPGFEFDLSEEDDLESLAKTYEKVATLAPIGIKHVYERFGIPAPGEGEETTGAGSQQAAVSRQKAPGKGGVVLPLREGGLEILPQDRQVIKNQTELEGLAREALAASAAMTARMLAPVRELIEAGDSLEAVRERLLEVYPKMPGEEMAELLYQAGMLAYMKARVDNG
jgi:phage gp29-like protein